MILHAAALDMFLSCVYLWDLTLVWQGRKVWCSSTTAHVWAWLLFGLVSGVACVALEHRGDVGKLRHWSWETIRSANYPESCWSCFELHSSVLLTTLCVAEHHNLFFNPFTSFPSIHTPKLEYILNQSEAQMKTRAVLSKQLLFFSISLVAFYLNSFLNSYT